MTTSTLEDVRKAIASGKKGYWGAMNVYVTGYVAESEFPRTFLYRGCTEDKGNGFWCCKSLERGPCKDHGQGGAWTYMFRFDIYVVDLSILYTAGPLRLTIFDAAISLIGMTPDLFHERDEIAQIKLVHAATQKLQTVCVYLSFNPIKDSFPIVEGVWMDKDGSRTPIRTPFALPFLLFHRFHRVHQDLPGGCSLLMYRPHQLLCLMTMRSRRRRRLLGSSWTSLSKC